MTNGKRRRLMIVMLVLCLLLIAGVGIQIWLSLTRTAVEYGATIITPTPAEVCPGDTISFLVEIAIGRGSSVSRVTEGWCRATDGICPKTLQEPVVYYNFITPYVTSTTANRVIPDNLTPGPWQLRHCNETHATNIIDVVCWQVDVEVKKDCP